MSPDIGKLRPIIEKGDKTFASVEGKIPPRMEAVFLGQAIRGLVDRYERRPPPATFRVLSSPMVAWIWIGGIIVFAGGLIAMWPSPEGRRGRVRAGYAARLARELGRA
jgi:cytochrome c-type biogenesis protein CcmF